MFNFLPFLLYLLCVPISGETTVDIQASHNIVGSSNILFTVTIHNPVISNYSYIEVEYPISDFVSTSFYCSLSPSSGSSSQACNTTDSKINGITYTGGGYYDPSTIILYLGYFKHLGISNNTQSFQFKIYGGVDQYTISKQVQLIPMDIQSIVFFLLEFI